MVPGSFVKKIYDRNPNLPFRDVLRAIERHWRGNPGRLLRNFRPVDSTRPLRCSPDAAVEVHTLTCHKHVFMYITSIKSLLRFVPNIAVVVHDDGSLTPKDIATIERHISGIRVMSRSDADELIKELLAGCPKTAAYRTDVINSLELTDHALLAATKRLVITNSDTLFLRYPEALVQWIETESDHVLCVYEKAPVQQAEFLAKMGSSFPPHMTLALLCLQKDLVKAEEMEECMARVDATDSRWFIGQNIMPLLIGKRLSSEKIEFLDRTLYEASAEFKEGAIFRHYWTSIANLRPQYFADASRVIAELKVAGN